MNLKRRSFLKRVASVISLFSLLPAAKGISAATSISSGWQQPAETPASAMGGTDPYIAEICIVPFNFAPRNWAFCNGQLLPIAQYTALFSLLGTTYGGNGKTNFALPDLQGRFPMHPGYGSGLFPRDLGEMGGSETVTLLESEIPAHIHAGSAIACYSGIGDSSDPVGKVFARDASGNTVYGPAGSASVFYVSGQSQPHNNMHPYTVCNYIIALQGIFPPRS